MLQVMQRSLGIWLLVGPSGLLGCGATGLDWVAEPEAPSAPSEARDVAMSEPLPAGARSGKVEPLPVAEDAAEHRRLTKTVTLGGDAAPPAPPGAQPVTGAGAERGTTVVINNYPSSPSYGYPYGVISSTRVGAGFGAGVTPASPPSNASSSPASTIQPGQNWSAPARSGPAFPFHVGPASPWEAERPR
jgi:hypothetical protein